MPRICIVLFAVGWGLFAQAVRADVVVYNDTALAAGFSDYSYNASIDLASTTHFHSGTSSIAVTPSGFGALKIASDNLLDSSTTPRLHFWLYATAAQCQALSIQLERDVAGTDTPVGNTGALGAYASCNAIAGSQWIEVAADLTASPVSYSGTFDRLSLFNSAGGNPGTFYVDEIALLTPANDLIFKNGFESTAIPPPACGMTVQHNVTVTPAPGDPMISDVFDWCDAGGKPREAVLAHNDQTGKDAGVYANHGGSLQQFSYVMPDNSTRTASITTYGNGGYGGFGYVVSHSAWASDGHCNGDDSPLGYSFPGTWTRVFEGRHHAIFRFQQNYQRHCGPDPNPPTTSLPVTIDWIFSTGRDNPLWAITYDMSAIAQNFLFDDSRAPYGELNIDGNGGNDIDGVAWGDHYQFSSTGATPLTLASTWTWNTPNTVPYIKEWTVAGNAAMGLVQTQTINQQDAGGGRNPYYLDMTAYWNTTSADGNACPGDGYVMPCPDAWPYQANAYSIYGGSNANARLTWGTQYGFLGQASYASNQTTAPDPDNGPYLSGWPRKSYSIYVVLGPHSTAPVDTQRTQVENVQTVTLTASTGSVATSGPAGVNRADTMIYAPPGYDPVYGALSFIASGNALTANIAVGAGTLTKPLIIVRGYGAVTYPAQVKLNGVTLAIDVDYFPSLRAGSSELWITLNRNLSGISNALQIVP